MRVLVCGGRDYKDRKAVFDFLNRLHSRHTITHVIQGGAKGTDRLADEWAELNWMGRIQFAADWKTHGKAAGPIRNKAMLEQGVPDLVVAFPGGRGTENMKTQARAAGVKVIEFRPAPPPDNEPRR